MSQFVERYTVRWGDLDVNRHLANSSYFDFFTDTRIRFLNTQGVTQEVFAEHQVGPVILNENIHYFREIKGGEQVYVDLECGGISENGTFFIFKQHMYNAKGEISAYLELLAAWFSIASRKLIAPPELIAAAVRAVPQSADFRSIKKEDTRRVGKEVLTRILPKEFL